MLNAAPSIFPFLFFEGEGRRSVVEMLSSFLHRVFDSRFDSRFIFLREVQTSFSRMFPKGIILRVEINEGPAFLNLISRDKNLPRERSLLQHPKYDTILDRC